MKHLVYVSGPFTAPSPEALAVNIERARLAGLKVRAAGFVPIVPHLAILNDNPTIFTYDNAMAECLQILFRCNAILMIDGWVTSEGARVERQTALTWGIPLFYDINGLSLYFAQPKSTKEQTT